MAEHFGRHVADVLAREAGVPDQLDASAEIEQHGGPALVHRQAEAVAADAELRSERSADRLSERDGRILDRMVLVDLQVSPDLQVERYAGVMHDLVEHVVEKLQSGVDPRRRTAVQIEADPDVGFPRASLDDGLSLIHI